MSYVADRASVADALGDDGQVLTLTYPDASVTYDPAAGTASGTPPSSQSVNGAFFPLSAFRKSQGNIVEGDMQLLLSAVNTLGAAITPPVVDGTVTDVNGKVWTLIASDPLAPAGIAVFYDCIARRAA